MKGASKAALGEPEGEGSPTSSPARSGPGECSVNQVGEYQGDGKGTLPESKGSPCGHVWGPPRAHRTRKFRWGAGET